MSQKQSLSLEMQAPVVGARDGYCRLKTGGKMIQSVLLIFIFTMMSTLMSSVPIFAEEILFEPQPMEVGITEDADAVSDTEVIFKNPPYHFYYPLMDCVGYIKPEKDPAIGKIGETLPLCQKKIQEGSKVYLEIEDESMVTLGDRFQLLRILPLSKTRYPSLSGHQHVITGIVEVIKLKKDPCKYPDQHPRPQGKIVTAYREILLNDILVPYNKQNSRILVVAPNDQVRGKILFSEEHATSITEDAVVFIDKGKIHGLKIGQLYDIYNQQKGDAAFPTPYMEKREYLGALMVIRMEDETAAALITYADKPITPGDLFFPSSEIKL